MFARVIGGQKEVETREETACYPKCFSAQFKDTIGEPKVRSVPSNMPRNQRAVMRPAALVHRPIKVIVIPHTGLFGKPHEPVVK